MKKRWTGEFPSELIERYIKIWSNNKPGANKIAPGIRSTTYPADSQGKTYQTHIWKNG